MTQATRTKGQATPLLSAMSTDLRERGALRARTAEAMWSAYGAHAAVTGWMLARRVSPVGIAPRPARLAGTTLFATGVGLCVAGMRRFTGPHELTGTRNEALRTTGIYRYSRNPQYLGYVLALSGAGVYRRSLAALASAAALAAIYNSWVLVEERHLAALHGQSYLDYTRRTPRWWSSGW